MPVNGLDIQSSEQHAARSKAVVTCIKNVAKMFYFICNHGLSSACMYAILLKLLAGYAQHFSKILHVTTACLQFCAPKDTARLDMFHSYLLSRAEEPFCWGRFLRATALLVARICYGNSVRLSVRLSVCLSVRPSHGWISQKRLKLRSCSFHHTVAPSL